jgi:hypothetical protein
VLRPQGAAVLDQDVKLLLEAVHGEDGELVHGRVDVAEVVPGLSVVGAAGQCQATAVP